MLRDETRGVHCRTDHPDADDRRWICDLELVLGERRELEARRVPLPGSPTRRYFAAPAGDGAGIYDVTVAADRTHTGTSEEGGKLELKYADGMVMGRVIAPNGVGILSAPMYDEGLFVADINTADIRRERIGLPLLRDERPEFQVRELSRIVAERAGLARDSTSDPDAEAGLDVAPGDRTPHPIGFRRAGGGTGG